MTTKSFSTRGVLVLSGAAALIGVGAGIVALAPSMFTDDTSIDDARIAETVAPPSPSEPVPVAAGQGAVAGGIAETIEVADPVSGATGGQISTAWVIPMSAPLEEFPIGSIPDENRSCIGVGPENINGCLAETKECTDDQLVWLETNAYKTTSPATPEGIWLGVMQFRNAATAGNALTIKEVQADGNFTEIQGESFALLCTPYFDGPIGAAATSSVYRPSTIDLSGTNPAIFGEPLSFGEDPTADSPAGTPAVLNLAPGETASLGVLSKAPARAGAFTGSLKATVESGTETDTLLIELAGRSTFSVAYASKPTAILQLHGGVMCPEPVEIYPGALRYQDIQICSLGDFMRGQDLG